MPSCLSKIQIRPNGLRIAHKIRISDQIFKCSKVKSMKNLWISAQLTFFDHWVKIILKNSNNEMCNMNYISNDTSLPREQLHSFQQLQFFKSLWFPLDMSHACASWQKTALFLRVHSVVQLWPYDQHCHRCHESKHKFTSSPVKLSGAKDRMRVTKFAHTRHVRQPEKLTVKRCL